MSVEIRFVDVLKKLTPPWLSDRTSSGRTRGFRLLWAMVIVLDAVVEWTIQGFFARYPGKGTPTALPLIARSRLLIRWQDESEASFTARLRAWLDTLEQMGTELELAKQIHGYLRSKPRVRIITRAGRWTTVNEDGSVEFHDAPWDWDSVSHPGRNDPEAPWWSDRWIVVYVSSELWPHRPGTLGDLTGDDGFARGHFATHTEVDVVKGIIFQWSGAHTRARAVIWTTDDTLFDPEDPETCPDGTWGGWSINDGGSQVLGGRDLESCRYWEPR